MKLKTVLWYLGVLATAGVLACSILCSSWILSGCTLVLALVLKATNKHIPLPKVYAKMGIQNEVFEGVVRDEKNH